MSQRGANVQPGGRSYSLGTLPGIVLSLFCLASPGLGIEAMSRGATIAVFVEDHPEAVKALRRNLEDLGLQGQTRVWPLPVTTALKKLAGQGERFDLVSVMSVDWIEAANNYAVLHCGAVDHVFGETLASLETRLDPAKFLRVHRSTIVNTARIVTVHTMTTSVSGDWDWRVQRPAGAFNIPADYSSIVQFSRLGAGAVAVNDPTEP